MLFLVVCGRGDMALSRRFLTLTYRVIMGLEKKVPNNIITFTNKAYTKDISNKNLTISLTFITTVV